MSKFRQSFTPRRTVLSASLVTAIAALSVTQAIPTAFAQQLANSDPARLLIDQGNYWQANKRGDLAAQAWQKLLAINPNQPDALFGMGIVEADRGQMAQAQGYLDRLKKAAPNYASIGTLASRLGQPTPTDSKLADARQLAQSGKTGQAAQRYREALAGKTMTPQLALEYYQTLGGTSDGWDEARRGLEKLAHDNPDNNRIALAYAQHLTYRESTRRDGIRLLSGLSTRSDVGDAARASWRQALIWLGARGSDTGAYQADLKVVPDDAAVKARLDAIAQQEQSARVTAAASAGNDARGRAVAAGFDALQKGDLDTATARFQGVLADHPNDTDALGGMGVLRLRQEKFSDAQQLLERASRGPNPGRWKSALASASYWSLVNSATASRQAGDNAKARDQLERAIRIDPNEITAQNALGDVLLAAGDPKGAEAAYRMVLRRQSDNPDAIRGVVGALTQQGRADEALQFAGQLSEQERQRIGGLGTLRAQQQQAEGRAAEQRGDLATARTDLENALLNDPQSPWIRLDLARVYRKQGALTNARSVMDGLLASNPDMPDALYASALLYGELSDWNRTLDMLARIPPQSRTRDMATLQRRAWVHASVDRANALTQQGQVAAAHSLLEQVQPVAGTDPELLGVVASAFAQTNDDNRAIGLIRQVMAQTSRPDAGMRIQYAGILLRTNQDAELAGVLRQIQSMRLTDAQRTDFGKLQQALAIRQADALRQQGDLPNAYEAIAPALAANPDDPDLQATLARLYAATGEYNQALQLYIAAHKTRPDDLDLTLAAAGTASQARNYSFAEDAIETALKQAPDNPRVLAAAGRIYRAEGKNGKAASYFRQALAAENKPINGGNGPLDMRLVGRDGTPVAAAQYSADRVPSNPFIGRQVINPSAPPQQAGSVGAGQSGVGTPTAGQFSGTGGPSAAPTVSARPVQGSFPYPTQAYPSQPALQQPTSSQSMPYLPPNSPPQYLQQAPAAYPSNLTNPRRTVGPDAYRPSDAGEKVAYVPSRSSGEDSEGAGYSGAYDSGAGQGGYPQQYAQNNGYPQQQGGYPQQYAQNNGYQQQAGYPQQYPQNNGYQQQAAYPQQYPQNNGYQQQAAYPQQYPQNNGYQQQAAYPQQYPQNNGYQQQAAYPQQYPQNNGYQQQAAYPQQYPQNNGYQQQAAYPQQYPQNNGYQQQAAYPQQYPQNNGYQQQAAYPQQYPQNNGYQQQAAYPQQYPQNNGYQQAAPLPMPWPDDPSYAPVARTAAVDTNCDSSGADGGTRAVAGGGTQTPDGMVCRPVTVAKKTVRKAPVRRAAPRYAPTYAQQSYPQQYAPAYPQQPPLPQYGQQQYAQQPVPQYGQQMAPAPRWNDNSSNAAPAPTGPLTIQQELDQINQQTSSTVAAGISIHNRSGESGLSTLTDIEAPIEGRLRAGNGHIVVRATPVTLDAGTPDATYAVGSRFGSGPAAAYSQLLNNGTAVGSQNATGIGLSGGYETDKLGFDVGTTPIGFKQTNIVGGINYRGAATDQVTYVLSGSRRAVTDSLLSYAGTTDNRSGLSWGGVVSSGGRLDVTYDDGVNGVYGYGSYGYITGKNVASNTRGEGGGGIYTRLLKEPDRELMAGLNVTAFGYDKNLSYFTYGQGGYFSPQQYVSISVPVSWSARSGRLSYQVKGSLGIQHFREDDSPYFPTSSSLQSSANAAQAAAAAAGATTTTSAVYPGQSKTGLGYNAQATAEYQFGPQMFVGGLAGIDNARDYRQWYGGLYLRYAFERMTGSPVMPPVPLHSPFLAN